MTDGGGPPAGADHPSVARVLVAAANADLAIEVQRFPQGTRTAVDAARAVGCGVDQIVKSLVFLAVDEPVVVLVSGADRVDPARLAAHLGIGASQVRRATGDEARAATGFSIGGIPPFGHPPHIRVVVDRGLQRHPVVWAAAGLPDAVFSVNPSELLRVARGQVAAVATVDQPAL
jgi:prolyl-tRNA editing enzyme YbaK/EbsC (Cys-tRNA(Pro) deacylase)